MKIVAIVFLIFPLVACNHRLGTYATNGDSAGIIKNVSKNSVTGSKASAPTGGAISSSAGRS